MATAGGSSLILASGSPQRRAILDQLGIAFTAVVTGVEELTAGEPRPVAIENACRKARAAAGGEGTEGEPGGRRTVLGVDTLVALEDRLYGKPADREQAVATITALAGRSHNVVSGICLIDADGERTAAAVTQVRFRPVSRSAIDWYVETGEWQGRAGGYAIQGRGAALVESIEGDYLNVVGLPVATLLDMLPSLLF